jgi:hypothetical protein
MLLAAPRRRPRLLPVTSFSHAAVARLLGLPAGTEPQLIVCVGHPAEHQPPHDTRAARSTMTPSRGHLVCFNLRVIVDGSYWVGRRAHHFDQRCS